MNLSRLVLLVHRWAGLSSCAFLLVVATSGAILVYEHQLNRILIPALHRIEPAGSKRPLAATLEAVAALHPRDTPSIVRRGAADDPDAVVLGSWLAVTVNPYTGTPIGSYRPNRSLLGVVGAIHSNLLIRRPGRIIVGLAGLIALLEAGTGLIRWWRYKTLWIARRATFRRAIFELHNVSGFFAVALVVPLSVTGVMIAFPQLFEQGFRYFDHPDQVWRRPATDTAAPQGPDDVVRIALAARPGEFTQLSFPSGPRGTWMVGIRGEGDHAPQGRIRVSINRAGNVVSVRDGGAGQLGTRMKLWRDGIHDGWILGGVGLLLAFAGGALLALQAVTGFLVWWKPR